MEKVHKLQLITSSLQSERQFEDLLIKHLNGLYTTALRLTGSREKAEDLVQESSLKAFRKFDQLQDTNKVKSWFLQILLNTFRDRYRKQKSKPDIVDIELTEELVASATIKNYDQDRVFGNLFEDTVQEALSQLPAEFRAVVILSDLEEYTYKEISKILQCSMGTVASRLFRGRQLLRECLEDYARNQGLLK